MTRLAILEFPDPRLRECARPVVNFGAPLAATIADLAETMYAAGAIGIAAPQVGIPLRLLVLDVSAERHAPQAYVNPEVLARDALGLVEESCLSLPGLTDSVPRATRIRVEAADARGVRTVRSLEGVAAVCLLHELDHLDGILFLDRLPLMRRWRARRVLGRRRAAIRGGAPEGASVRA
jgi:peptide deformylase